MRYYQFAKRLYRVTPSGRVQVLTDTGYEDSRLFHDELALRENGAFEV